MKNNNELQEGCVYYFFNDSTNKNSKNNSKNSNNKKNIKNIINKNDFYTRNELTNVKKIHTINNYKIYYYVCENSTELTIKNIQEDDISIEENSHNENKISDTILLKFEDREIIYLKNYLKALSSPRKYILSLIHFYKHLLKSIQLLVDKQIIHNHINFDSIIVDNHYDPLLTNFSFSLDMSHQTISQYIHHFIIDYDPSYLEWPIEFHILAYLLTNKLNSLSSFNIENIVNNVIDNHSILKTFGESVVSSYKLEAIEYFNKYVNHSYEYILTDILQYSSTWDNYALSILFLRILIGLHKSMDKKNKFIILFMKLLVGNIHLNPFKRLSISSTTNKFDSILDSLEPKDYKEIIHGLMSA